MTQTFQRVTGPPAVEQTPLVDIGRNTRASAHLDFIRGFAAIAVVAEHSRNLFFVDGPEIAHRSILRSLCYFLTGFGHQMVMVFFVLSGYFIVASILRDIKKGRWSWKRYLTNRGTRLYVVLIPALVLTFAWDRAGIARSDQNSIYQGGGEQVVVKDVPAHSGLGAFVGNVLFLQTVRVPTFGSNGPLWSLSNEFWYYILFPCVLLVFLPRTSLVGKIVAILIALAIVVGCRSLLSLFPVWLMGGALTILPYPNGLEGRWARRAALGISGGVFVVCISAARLNVLHNGLLGDYLTGASFAALTFFILHLRGKPHGGFYEWISRHLAGTSYTIYLTHVPPLVFAAAVLGAPSRWQPTGAHFSQAVLIVVGILMYSVLIALLTEANTDRIRRLVSSS